MTDVGSTKEAADDPWKSGLLGWDLVISDSVFAILLRNMFLYCEELSFIWTFVLFKLTISNIFKIKCLKIAINLWCILLSCVHTLSQMCQTMFQSQRDPSFYSRLQCSSLCCQSLTSGVTPLREWERKLQTWINVTWIKCRLWTFLPDSVTSVFYLLVCLTIK